MAICVACSGLCALRVTWCGSGEGEDKDCGVFTQLRAVWRRRSDMWWQHSATLLTQPASPGYWGRDHPRLDYLQACMPSKIFWEDTLRNPPLQGLLIGCCYHLLMGLTTCKATFFPPLDVLWLLMATGSKDWYDLYDSSCQPERGIYFHRQIAEGESESLSFTRAEKAGDFFFPFFWVCWPCKTCMVISVKFCKILTCIDLHHTPSLNGGLGGIQAEGSIQSASSQSHSETDWLRTFSFRLMWITRNNKIKSQLSTLLA